MELESIILGDEDSRNEVTQTPQSPVADQKYEAVPVPTTNSSQASFQSASALHHQPPTPSLDITQPVGHGQPIVQPEKDLVAVPTPVVPSAQVRPPEQTTEVPQGNHNDQYVPSLDSPTLGQVPVYSEPPVQQLTSHALPE
jgi:hypothetical protein